MRQLNDSEWVVSSRHAPNIVICFSNAQTHSTAQHSHKHYTTTVDGRSRTKCRDQDNRCEQTQWIWIFFLRSCCELCVFVFIRGINIFSVVALDGMESNWHIQNGDVRWMMDTLIYALFGCDGAHGRKCCSIHSPANWREWEWNAISPLINM